MGDQIKMLSHLSTLEVSNVKRAANRKRYAITKSESTVDIQKIMSVKAEGEEQFVATLKSEGATQDRIDAATAAYRIRKNCADVLKPEDMGVVAKAHKEPDGDEQGDDESDAEFKARKAKKSVKKSDVSPEMDARIEALFKSNADLLQKNAELAGKVETLTAKSADLEFEAVAKSEFGHVRGSVSELAQALKAAHEAGPEAEKAIRNVLKSAEEITSKSAMLHEVGSSGGGTNGSAWQKIEALAGGLTMKSDSGKEMSKSQKIDYVVSKTAEGRALYEQYNREQDQAIKRA